MTQICTKCKTEKPLSDFFIRHDRGRHYTQCKACWKEKSRKFMEANPSKNSDYYHAWKKKFPERVLAVQREMKARQRRDPLRRFVMAFRTAVASALQGREKSAPTFELLGYSSEVLKAHIERQFLKGMSWENYGQWHLDHIVPLSAFAISIADSENLKAAWAITNLRPLWARDNQIKHAKRTHLL